MDKSILLNYTTMRKCVFCKEYITLEKQSGEYSYHSDKLYHNSCLKNKLLNKKIGKLTVEQIDKLIVELKDDTEKHTWNLIVKNHIYKYLMDSYNLIILPTYIYQKLEQIFSGQYKNMTKPIKPEHLLDMWQRQKPFLDKIWHKEKMDGAALINYNLQVLINKYNGYLDWLGKKEVDLEKANTYTCENKVVISDIPTQKTELVKNILDEDGEEE